MRKSVVLVATFAIVAGGLILMLVYDSPGSQTHTESSPDPSAATRPPMSMEVLPAPNYDSTEQKKSELVASENSGEPVELIPTPPEFDRIPANKVFWHHEKWRQLHQRLEQEPIDLQWSRAAETTIGSAIGEHQEIIRFGTPVINCRTTICEVQMLAFGAPEIDEGEWSTRFGAVYRNLRTDFSLEDFSVAVEPGGTAMVLYISRKE